MDGKDGSGFLVEAIRTESPFDYQRGLRLPQKINFGAWLPLMELDPKYADVIVKRWQDFTGKKATHADTGFPFAG
jgi:hypothetical protein